jgi:hypothetical protein
MQNSFFSCHVEESLKRVYCEQKFNLNLYCISMRHFFTTAIRLLCLSSIFTPIIPIHYMGRFFMVLLIFLIIRIYRNYILYHGPSPSFATLALHHPTYPCPSPPSSLPSPFSAHRRRQDKSPPSLRLSPPLTAPHCFPRHPSPP